MLDYLKNYLVKSYLLLNTNAQVMIEYETSTLTLRRNFAFMHMYVLALFWRNSNRKVLPPNMNYFMEFEYGLIGKAFNLINQIGQDFTIRNKQKDP
jgi:hypothetical protein